MNMAMHVETTVHIAPDGRSIQGTTQATGEVNDYVFASPPTRYIEVHRCLLNALMRFVKEGMAA